MPGCLAWERECKLSQGTSTLIHWLEGVFQTLWVQLHILGEAKQIGRTEGAEI